MKRALALVLLVAAMAVWAEAIFPYETEDLTSDEALWDLYDRWAAHHGVVREAGRFSTFKRRALKIHSYKARAAGKKPALNLFADKTESELDTFSSCLKEPDLLQLSAATATAKSNIEPADDEDLPSSFDWRESNAVTPVKSQDDCACCWAFATTGRLPFCSVVFSSVALLLLNFLSDLHAARLARTEFLLFSSLLLLVLGLVQGVTAVSNRTSAFMLSEQFLLDCTLTKRSKANNSCSGGNILDALDTIKAVGGIPSAADYTPYVAAKGVCNDLHEFVFSAHIGGWFTLAPYSLPGLKRAVTISPVAVAIGVDFDFLHWPLQNEPGAIYHGPGNKTLVHMVLLVGYGRKDGDDYWIVKNSWSDYWGDAGYIYMGYDAERDGKEGVAGILTFPVIAYTP